MLKNRQLSTVAHNGWPAKLLTVNIYLSIKTEASAKEYQWPVPMSHGFRRLSVFKSRAIGRPRRGEIVLSSKVFGKDLV